MKFGVLESQVRDGLVVHEDLIRVNADLAAGPFDTRENAEAWNEQERNGDAAIVEFGDEYLEGTVLEDDN